MKKTAFLSLLVLLVGAGWLAGCGEGERGRTSDGRDQLTLLTMALSPTFDDYIKGVAAEFEAEHPTIKVNWVDFPYQGYDTKIMTSMLGPNPMDVLNLSNEAVRSFAATGHLLPLDTVLSEEELSIYVPSLLNDAGTVNGHVYALPWYASTDVVMINKALWEQAGLTEEDIPQNVKDLRRICEIFREKTDAFAWFPLYTEAGSLRGYFHDAGVPLFNEDGTKAAFNTPLGVEVLEYWTDLYKDGLVPREALTAIHRRPIELFKANRLGILATGPQFIRQVRDEAPSIYENMIITGRLSWPGVERYGVAVHMIAVANRTRHPELAAQLAHLITNDENQLAFSKLTTIYPSTTAALSDPYFSEAHDSPEGRARIIGAEQLHKATVFIPPPHANEFNRILNTTMEDVALGRKDAAEALRWAEERVNALLAR